MVRCDPFGRTEGMRRQVNDLILTAYSKGYNDGEHDEQDRKLEMLLKDKKGKWKEVQVVIGRGDFTTKEYECEICGYRQIRHENFCGRCGARMEE